MPRKSRPSRGSDGVADPFEHVTADVEIEVLHGRIVAALVHARADALLHRFANRPVLAVHEIPELSGVARIEAGPGELVRLEQKMAHDVRTRGALGLKQEDRRVVAGETQKEIRVEEFPLVPHPLILVEAWEGAPPGGPRAGEGIRTGTMRDAAQPVEVRAAAVLERRHDGAQL